MIKSPTRSANTDSGVWNETHNCYGYALGRPDMGWVNPGWVSKVFNKAGSVSIKDVFNVYTEKDRDAAIRKVQKLLEQDGHIFLGRNIKKTLLERHSPDEIFLCVVRDGKSATVDYHCYRYDGQSRWSDKNGSGNVYQLGYQTPQTMLEYAKTEGRGRPVGFFKAAVLPSVLSDEQHKRLDALREKNIRFFTRLRASA